MLIFIRQANGNGFSLDVAPTSQINCLRQDLKQLINEDLSNSKIYFKGQIIDSLDTTFQELDIKENDILHIRKIQQNNIKQKHINLSVFYNNETYSFRLNNQELVSKLKYKIYDVTNIHPKQQYLVFRGKKLHQNASLSDQKIQNDSLISLIWIQKKQSILIRSQHILHHDKELFDSITSLKLRKTISNAEKKTSLYRSDSIGSKANQVHNSPQIQVKYAKDYIDLAASVQSEIQFSKILYNHKRFPQNNQNNNKSQYNQMFEKQMKILTLGGSCQLPILKQEQQYIFSQEPPQMDQMDQIEEQFKCQQSSESPCDDNDSLYKQLGFEQNSLWDSLQSSQKTQNKKNQMIGTQQIINIRKLNPQFAVIE